MCDADASKQSDGKMIRVQDAFPALRRFIGVVVTMSLVSACASLPEGVLVPVEASVPGTTQVPILVATTRAPSDDPGLLYSGERGSNVELREIVVSIPPDANREIGEVQWPKKLPPDPAGDFATLSVSPLEGVEEARAWVRRNRSPSGRLLIFVHGFNNRYEDAVYRFAQIAHDSGTQATPVLFTWPSRGSLFAYGYDKESTNFSRTALENVFAAAASDPDIGEITVLAHSMGTWLTVESLRQMAIRRGGIPKKIANVILAAPDLDIDVFRQQLADMGPDRPPFTVFVSRDDQALRVSRRISGNIDRLGAIDIANPEYLALLEREGIVVLDLSALRGGDRLNHSKFAQSPEVVRLLGDRLIAGQTVTDQNIGLGEHLGAAAIGVTNTVGSAASLAVSVPIAVIDPATRESLDDQAERFGQHLGNAVTGIVEPPPAPTRPARACLA
jgi:esterase/lipase superfamily enzyme